MFIILTYDANTKRVGKLLKTCRKYLTWVQNSVFEGEISDANYAKLMIDLSKVMDKAEDSVIIYNLRTTKYYTREIVGKEKSDTGYII